MDAPVEVGTPQGVLAGVSAPDESWWSAARRLAATAGAAVGGADPAAVDLSGPVKRFEIDPDLRITLRPMTTGDLPDVVRWRTAAHVRRWWAGDGEPTPEAVTALYLPRITGVEPTRMWVWEVNGRSVGFVQDYALADYPDYALLTPDSSALGVDYLIGEPEWVGRGLGTRCLWAWAVHAVRREAQVPSFFAAPDHRNRPSLRVLAKVGFVEGLWFDEPQPDGSVDTVIGCTLDVPRVLGGPVDRSGGTQ